MFKFVYHHRQTHILICICDKDRVRGKVEESIGTLGNCWTWGTRRGGHPWVQILFQFGHDDFNERKKREIKVARGDIGASEEMKLSNNPYVWAMFCRYQVTAESRHGATSNHCLSPVSASLVIHKLYNHEQFVKSTLSSISQAITCYRHHALDRAATSIRPTLAGHHHHQHPIV